MGELWQGLSSTSHNWRRQTTAIKETMMASGGCLCGDITYEYDQQQSTAALHCHCRDCQKVTGSGKATIVLFPEDAVKITGTFKQYGALGSDGSHVNRGFCSRCGSQMFTHIEEMPGLIFVKAGTLDDSSWVQVSLNCWESTASQWSPADSELPGAEKNPNL
ncbi:MAG: GFA family protein [Halieaceae bacterium]|jgi:hypothetical protein|nr:GFA family protein [Halieaceae bacterium]MBT5209670.1 GFA family protein [Halieaceae bacterium]MBT6264741.1 GFA family protein [Halieaceae bacterium]